MGGGDLHTDERTMNFLTNADGLEINGLSTNNHPYYQVGNVTKWVADLGEARKAVAVFNEDTEKNVTVSVDFSDLGLDDKDYSVRDVFHIRELGKMNGGF